MAFKRMLPPMPLLLFVVLLWLSLDPREAARVASDRVVFPSERATNATETGPKPWDMLPEMNPRSRLNLKEIRNGTTSNQVQPGNEIKSRAGLPGNANETRVEPTRNDITGENIFVPTNATTEVSGNATRPKSEDKMITFGMDSKIRDGNRTDTNIGVGNRTEWTMAVAPAGNIPIGPRITLESIRICPEGFTLSNDHCRKTA